MPKLRRYQWTVDDDLFNKIETIARRNGQTVAKFLREAAEERLKFLLEQEADAAVADLGPDVIKRALERFQENPAEFENYRRKQEALSRNPEIQRIDREVPDKDSNR